MTPATPCAVNDCATLTNRRLFCRAHWRHVDAGTRDQLRDAYRRATAPKGDRAAFAVVLDYAVAVAREGVERAGGGA